MTSKNKSIGDILRAWCSVHEAAYFSTLAQSAASGVFQNMNVLLQNWWGGKKIRPYPSQAETLRSLEPSNLFPSFRRLLQKGPKPKTKAVSFRLLLFNRFPDPLVTYCRADNCPKAADDKGKLLNQGCLPVTA